jgi:hypothetical protein
MGKMLSVAGGLSNHPTQMTFVLAGGLSNRSIGGFCASGLLK